ncbi:YopX family protein [Bacillus sp. FJAT-22090]|uniref:YopX family protein n=1 Tax=Bacillus sp. FJAT-22090 TaxID=1581038 RepID=UPI0011A4413C|nr:YopX family protein [Bacillus sp. FJAT-22090]
MREIKFRAWFTKDKAMAHVDKLEFNESYRNSPVHADVWAKTDFEKGGWYTPLRAATNRKTVVDGSKEQVPRVVLMQYTGIDSENGVEIFEGDIVKQEETLFGVVDTDLEITGVVKMLEGCWVIDSGEDSVHLWSETACNQILGNIYETSELMEVEANA